VIATGVGLAGAEDDIEALIDDDLLPPLSPSEGMRRRLYRSHIRQEENRMNALAAFRIPKGRDLDAAYSLVICPQVLFKAEGLMVWGVTDDSYIEQIHVGHQIVADVCGAPIPARFFSMAQSWEEVEKQVKEHGISGPAWVTWPTNHLGCQTVITIRGPMANALVWGKAVW
jgi:hypothetical protein